jgi:DNA repair exonuclease SbcCD ATPase subunit
MFCKKYKKRIAELESENKKLSAKNSAQIDMLNAAEYDKRVILTDMRKKEDAVSDAQGKHKEVLNHYNELVALYSNQKQINLKLEGKIKAGEVELERLRKENSDFSFRMGMAAEQLRPDRRKIADFLHKAPETLKKVLAKLIDLGATEFSEVHLQDLKELGYTKKTLTRIQNFAKNL